MRGANQPNCRETGLESFTGKVLSRQAKDRVFDGPRRNNLSTCPCSIAIPRNNGIECTQKPRRTSYQRTERPRQTGLSSENVIMRLFSLMALKEELPVRMDTFLGEDGCTAQEVYILHLRQPSTSHDRRIEWSRPPCVGRGGCRVGCPKKNNKVCEPARVSTGRSGSNTDLVSVNGDVARV